MIGNLNSLITLHLSSCKSLTTKPEELGNLTYLKTLDLEEYEVDNNPGGVEELDFFDNPTFEKVCELENDTGGIGNLTSLTNLDVRRCMSLILIPDGIGGLDY